MSKKRSKVQNWMEYLLFKTFFGLVKLMPFSLGCWVGEQLTVLAFYLLYRRRQLTIENIRLARANGYLTTQESDYRLALNAWKHLGRVSSEFLYFYSHDLKLLKDAVTIEGRENLDRALAKQKGVILIMAHIGNWELLGSSLALAGYDLCPLVKKQSNELVDKVIEAKRRSVGMRVVSRTGFLRPVIAALKRNGIVPFLMDQAVTSKGVSVEFFGRQAWFPRGPAEFALKTETPALFAYLIRENSNRYRLIIAEEIDLTHSGNYQNDLAEATSRFSILIQAAIEQYPEQWLWMHKLWR